MISKDLSLIEKEIKKNLPRKEIVSIILFGSAVKSMKKAKDYDLLVITKKPLKKEWMLAGTIKANLLGKTGKPLDIVFLEENDLKYPTSLLYEVAKKHKLLYGKNVIPLIKGSTRNVDPIFERGVVVGWQIA